MLAITPERDPRPKRATILAFPSGRMLLGLGIVPPDSAFADLVMPPATITGRAGATRAVYQGIRGDIANGFILSYSGANPLHCSRAGNASSIKGGLTKMSSGIALKLVSGGTVAGPAAPFVIAGGAILGLFGAIFNHHALAVAREQGVLCAAVPAFNAAVTAVNQAVQNGTVTPEVASGSVGNILQDFLSAVAPIAKECNAACVVAKSARGIAAKYQAVYAEAIAQRARGSAAAGRTPVSHGDFGNILPWAAAAGLLLYAVAG